MAANRCVFFSRVGPLPNLFVFFPNERREKGKQKPLFARRGGKYTRKKLELKLCSVWRTQLGEKRERDESIYIFDWYNNDEMKKVDEEREKSGGEKRTETHSSSPQTQNEID